MFYNPSIISHWIYLSSYLLDWTTYWYLLNNAENWTYALEMGPQKNMQWLKLFQKDQIRGQIVFPKGWEQTKSATTTDPISLQTFGKTRPIHEVTLDPWSRCRRKGCNFFQLYYRRGVLLKAYIYIVTPQQSYFWRCNLLRQVHVQIFQVCWILWFMGNININFVIPDGIVRFTIKLLGVYFLFHLFGDDYMVVSWNKGTPIFSCS